MRSIRVFMLMLLFGVIFSSHVAAQYGPPRETSLVITPETPFGAYGQPMNLRITNLVSPVITGRWDTPIVNVSALGEDGRFAPICAVRMATIGSCMVPGRYHRQKTAIYRANYDGNLFNLPAEVFFNLQVEQERATLKLSKPTMPFVAGRSVTLSAFVRARALTGLVTFLEGELPIPGCINRPILAVNDAIDAGVSDCHFDVPLATAARTATYTARYQYPSTPTNFLAGRSTETSEVSVDLAIRGPEDYTDLWWAGLTENGWGMAITNHGDRQVAMLYAYDEKGDSAWYIMPGGQWNESYTTITGELLRPFTFTSPGDYSTGIKLDVSVGSISINFKSKTTATVGYTINGMSGSKNILRQAFGAQTSNPSLRLADMWWFGSRENGYGFSLAQQGGTIVPIEYQYRIPTAEQVIKDITVKGTSQFVISPSGTWSGTFWVGESYTTRASPWLGATYDPARLVAIKTGNAFAIDFEDLDRASVQYEAFGGVKLWKQATRLPF